MKLMTTGKVLLVILMLLLLTVASLTSTITTKEEQPGRPRFFRFSQHRQRNGVQSNEFYQLSMNANLVACGEGSGVDVENRTRASDTMGATKRTGIDDSCQDRIVAEISIETAASGHHSWDNDDMHLHFLLDEVHLPDSGAYGRPKDTFAINVTLEVPYVRYRLEKVQVLNCYVTGHDPSKSQSTPPTEQNTDKMVSSSSAEPSQESGHAETKKQLGDNRGEEPDDWEWEQQSKRQHLDGFYDDDDEKEGRGRLQGNDEAAEVYADDDYGTDSDDTSTEARKQHFSNYHRYHQNRIGPTPGETLQWTTQSSISHSTNRRHLSPEDANEAYFYDEDFDGKMTGGNANDADFYDQHNHFDNNYCHIERDTFSRTARSGGRQSSQLKRFGIYMQRNDSNATDVEYSSIVSIATWPEWSDTTEQSSDASSRSIVEPIRLTSSSNIYVNQISSIEFQAWAAVARDTVSSQKSRGLRQSAIDKDRHRQPKENSRKNNQPRNSTRRSKNRYNPNELMLIDPSGMGGQASEKKSSSGEANWVEKLLWVGGGRSDDESTETDSSSGGGNRLKRKSFRSDEEEKAMDGSQLYCPGLGPWRKTMKVESIGRHFGGGARTRLRNCEDGLCLEAPVPMAVAFKYEIQLAYFANLVAPLDQNQLEPHDRSIKITNIITSFRGPMVNNDEGNSMGGSRVKRTPSDKAGTQKSNNSMLVELALVYLGHPGQRHHSELVRVNIDANCLSYLSSITGVAAEAENSDADQQLQVPKMVRLRQDQLEIVQFQLPVDVGVVAVRNEEIECAATVSRARSGPPKSATRSRRHSSNSNSSERNYPPEPLSSRTGVLLAERKFLIKPGARCVCSDFVCQCTCLLGMVPPEPKSTPGASDGSCQMIITFGGAGEDLHQHRHPHQTRGGFWHWFWVLLLLALLVLFLLGCVKAVLGCCWTRIGKWKYDFLQPEVRYKDASSYRRFLINLIFFLVYPCVLCCRCFERSINEEDEDGRLQDFQGRGDDERDRLLQQHGLLKGARVVQKQVPLSTTSIATTTTSADEEDVLGDGWDSTGGGGAGNRKQLHSEEIATTDDDELSKLLAGMQSEAEEVQQPAGEGARRNGRRPYYNNTEDEDNDTRFVLDVMNQSRKSLQTARRPRYSSKHANRGHPPYHTESEATRTNSSSR